MASSWDKRTNEDEGDEKGGGAEKTRLNMFFWLSHDLWGISHSFLFIFKPMARNSEKNYSQLNRFLLAKEDEKRKINLIQLG